MIVTIDGPAGSGKSTAARLVAARLGFEFLDTGAMYRAVGLACLGLKVPLDDEARVAEVARGLRIEALGPVVRSNGRDVTAAIRAGSLGRRLARGGEPGRAGGHGSPAATNGPGKERGHRRP